VAICHYTRERRHITHSELLLLSDFERRGEWMKLQQLRYLCEVVEQGFNITNAANAMFTSQPGISKQIRLLEQELGVEILARSGNRIVGLTEAGAEIVRASRRVLVDTLQLEAVAHEFTLRESGQLVVATTHLHARYPLLPVIKKFCKKYPDVHLNIFQGSPAQIANRLLAGEADIGISTRSEELSSDLIALAAYPVYRCVVAPLRHPVLDCKDLSLEEIAKYPLIVYDASFSSGSVILQAFQKASIHPNIVLRATDADVIKSYVAAGLGIAVLQKLAFDPVRDLEMGVIDADHLFPPSNTNLIINRSKYLRRYMLDFMAMIAPAWTPAKVHAALMPSEGGTR
jgi:LysR family cys regulon transcriptional activator